MALNYLVDTAMASVYVSSIGNERPACSVIIIQSPQSDRSTQTRRHYNLRYYLSRRPTKTTLTNSNSERIYRTNTFFKRKTATHNTDHNGLAETTSSTGECGDTKDGGRRKKTMKKSTLNINRGKTRSGDPNHVTKRERLQSNDEYNYRHHL